MTTACEKPSDGGSCLPAMIIALTLVTASLLPNDAVAQAPSVPGYAGQVMLIKNTIVAVNHGNITGNYTVLRDLASERFRKQNTASDLATTFASMRKQKLDLSPILVTEPQLTQQPAEDKFRGRLQLVGYFSTRPQAVRFALIFQHIQGGWVIDEISVAIGPTESVTRSQGLPPVPSQDRRNPAPRAAQRPPSFTPLMSKRSSRVNQQSLKMPSNAPDGWKALEKNHGSAATRKRPIAE